MPASFTIASLVVGKMFVVLAQTPVPPQPREGPFYHPPTAQRHESTFPRRPTQHQDLVESVTLLEPAVQLLVVRLVVCLHHLQAVKGLLGTYLKTC